MKKKIDFRNINIPIFRRRSLSILFLIFLFYSNPSFSQCDSQLTQINITTSGGDYPSEKWVNITTGSDGSGTQIWGQGNGTYGNSQGLINVNLCLPPGTYWVNCFDRYADGWDGTLISVTYNAVVLGNNGGFSPDDGIDSDTSSLWESTMDELEASFPIIIPEPPGCISPTGTSLETITPYTAEFRWEEVESAVSYNWFVFENNADIGSATPVASGNTTELTATATGLDTKTEYDFYVRTYCNADSYWAAPYNFTTAAAIPWIEEFVVASMPTGWASTGFFFGTLENIVNAEGGAAGFFVFSPFYPGRETANFQTIHIGSVSIGDFLSFVYKLSNYNPPYAPPQAGSGNFILAVSTDNGANYTDIETVHNNGIAGWQNYSYDLSSYVGQNVRFRITGNRASGDYLLSFDNFFVGDSLPCVTPTGVSLEATTASTAEFSWGAVDGAETYNWFVFENDADPESAIPVASGNTTEISVTASGLDPVTGYDFYVQTDCGTDETSDFSFKVDFTTECIAVADFNENFDGILTPELPNCWSYVIDGFTSSIFATVGTSTTNYSAPNGVALYNANSGASSNIILVSPEITNLSDGTHWLRFYASNSIASQDIEVGTISGSTFTPLETIDINTTFSEYTVSFAGYAGTDTHIAIRRLSTSTYTYVYLDNIVYEEITSCFPPTGVTLGDVDGHTVDFSWGAIDNAEGYNWFVFENDANPESATPVASGNTTEISVNASGLDPETDYDFYIQTDCGTEDGTSELSEKVDFTTTVACLAPTNLSHEQLSMTSAELSWESDGTLFELKWGEAGFDVETEGTLVDDLTETSYELEGLTIDADYEFYVRSDCNSNGFSTWTGPYSFSVGYCAVGEPSSNDDTGITYVGLNTIDNPSETAEEIYYSDFTAISTDLQAGGSYDLNVRVNTDGSYTVWAYAWIDWDNDGAFDTSTEQYNLGSANSVTDGNTSGSPFSLEIPINASGEFRMRVKAVYGNTAIPHPCNVQTYSETEDYTINVLGPVTWTGTEWINGTPAGNVSVLVNGNLSIANDAPALEVKNMFVSENGSLTIEPGNSLTVIGKITNENSAASFVVESGGNLIQYGIALNSGAITVKSESQPMIRLDYTLWSSPVIGQNLFGFSPETVNGVTNYAGSPGRIYVYDGNSGYVNPNPFLETTEMNSGVGYLFRSPNNFHPNVPAVYEGIFTGVPFNEDFSVATVANNYTSIGNPYPSNLDAYLLFNANLGLNTLYFWVNTPLVGGEYLGSNYATYNLTGGVSNTGTTIGPGVPSGIIAVGQGFIVATSESFVIFNNSMRTDGATDFFRPSDLERHRFWLNLSNDSGVGLNQILIAYMEGATMGIDQQIDGKMFGYEGSALYNIIDNDAFVIQGRSLPFADSDVVPLGFRATENGKFKIELDNFDGLFAEGQAIYVKDNLLGIQHKLTNSAYEFESEAGTFKDRFEIVYVEEGIMGIDDLTANGILIYKNQNLIEISSKESPIDSVEIFDLSGRKLFSESGINSPIFQVDSKQFGTQVLIVKVKTKNGKMKTKKLMNK